MARRDANALLARRLDEAVRESQSLRGVLQAHIRFVRTNVDAMRLRQRERRLRNDPAMQLKALYDHWNGGSD